MISVWNCIYILTTPSSGWCNSEHEIINNEKTARLRVLLHGKYPFKTEPNRNIYVYVYILVTVGGLSTKTTLLAGWKSQFHPIVAIWLLPPLKNPTWKPAVLWGLYPVSQGLIMIFKGAGQLPPSGLTYLFIIFFSRCINVLRLSLLFNLSATG